MTPTRPLILEHRLADVLPELVDRREPKVFPDPAVVLVNDRLAAELALDPSELASTAPGWLAGGPLPPGSDPVAVAYAGHQFGHLNPQLGDGRALLLGEYVRPGGSLVDVQLKGSGRTRFSRGGDGRAALDSVLREYIVSEAMAALGVPTTRSLAALTTGEGIRRDRFAPGAVLVRLASSHLRVGTLVYLAIRGQDEVVRRVVDVALARHYPERVGADRPALALLEAVVEAQAELVAAWMSVGFVHGVMNTDNTTLSGETIDYGPCAFMERTDPSTVFSRVDEGGRYRFGQQPSITLWNLARLAETLLPLLHDDPDQAIALAEGAIGVFPDLYRSSWIERFRGKLGLDGEQAADVDLATDLLAHMHTAGLDFTSTFRSLAEDLRHERPILGGGLPDWEARWRSRLVGRDVVSVAADMDRVNPLYIPRNHRIEEALQLAVSGDLSEVRTLIEVLSAPFTEQPGREAYAQPAPDDACAYQTHCNT